MEETKMNGKQLDDTRSVIESGDREKIEKFNRAALDKSRGSSPQPAEDGNQQDWSQWKAKRE
jgi:hypothetical protein